MLKLTKLMTLLLLPVFLLNANLAQALANDVLPKKIQLEYDVKRNGKLFARVKENFTQDGKQYRVESTTKGVGVYALFGARKLSSVGEVTKDGLKPKRFELRQGNSASKTLIADFDWAKSTLKMQVKGETKTEPLDAGTQDLSSYVYQFMYNPPASDDIKVTMTTGKKLNHYQYKVVDRNLKLQAAKTSYNTLHIANVQAAGDDKKQLWLAQDQYYLPVRYSLTDEDGANFEQTLTKINVE
jgi:Protein of unknown function (DUF3108)